jgi:hypothetical protein
VPMPKNNLEKLVLPNTYASPQPEWQSSETMTDYAHSGQPSRPQKNRCARSTAPFTPFSRAGALMKEGLAAA